MKFAVCTVLLSVLNSFKLSGIGFNCLADMFLLKTSVTAVFIAMLIISAVAHVFEKLAMYALCLSKGIICYFGCLYICGLVGADTAVFSPGSAEIYFLAAAPAASMFTAYQSVTRHDPVTVQDCFTYLYQCYPFDEYHEFQVSADSEAEADEIALKKFKSMFENGHTILTSFQRVERSAQK